MMNRCDECPMKVANPKGYCFDAVGNPAFGRLIVVPCVDKSAYKHGDMTFSDFVEIIRDALYPLTGGLDGFMVAPMIRCMPTKEVPVDQYIAQRCIAYSFRDIRVNKLKKVIFLGDAARYMNFRNIKSSANTIFMMHGVGYSVSYSPLVKNTDRKMYLDFVEQLRNWYSASKYNNYNGMKIVSYDT